MKLNDVVRASAIAKGPSRNLVLARAGDKSLHPYWLIGADRRDWHLHISYFGSKDAPPGAGLPGVTWTRDLAKTKWGGINECLEKNPFDLTDYDYIATPDDDLLMGASTYNRAFALARKYNLAYCQLSLDPRSFYSHGLTIRRKGLLLRYVDVIEAMPPIHSAEVFAHAKTLLTDPANSWGLEYVIAAPLRDKPRSMAILDDCPVLHTRALGSSEMYAHFRAANGGRSMAEVEAEYLTKHGVVRYQRSVLGALDKDGAEVNDMSRLRRPAIAARLINEAYKLFKIRNIAPRAPLPNLIATESGVEAPAPAQHVAA